MKLAALMAVAGLATGATALAAQDEFPTRLVAFEIKAGSGKVTMKGTLGSAEERCIKGRKVKLIREQGGDKQTLGKDESGKHGDFKVATDTKPKEGKYYGKVKEKTLGDGDDKQVCLERVSASVKLTVD